MKFLNRLLNLHPVTWWAFGLALAITAGISTNPFVLIVTIGFCLLAIIGARSLNSSLAKSNLFFWLAGFVIITRVVFRIIFNYASSENDILFSLPRIEIDLGLGDSVGLFGSVSRQTMLAALTDGLRLAAIILSVAFASTLSNPRRLLKSTPAALFEIASAISVAINLAPQLIQSVHRVRRARSLRGRSKGLSTLTGTVIPILEDTLDKSLDLAASMDSRGFGRRGNLNKTEVLISRMLSLTSILIITVAVFLMLASVLPGYLLVSLLISGVACGALSIRITSSRSNRTQLSKNKRILIDYMVYGVAAIIVSAAFAGWFS